MFHLESDHAVYGLLAEFPTPEALVGAVDEARRQGFRQMDAYAPFPIEGLAEALGHAHTSISRLALCGAVLGGVSAFALMYYGAAISYPVNVGGRPLNSWPAFIPITFELTILGAALASVFGMLILNGLPQPHHPLFEVPQFKAASRDGFFLCIEASDPRFELSDTRAFLEGFLSARVFEVPA